MVQSLVRGHGYERDEKVLDHVCLPDCIPDVSSGDFDMALCLERIVEQDAIADNLRFTLVEVAPAASTDQWPAITGLGRDEECENEPSKDSYESFHWGVLAQQTTSLG